MQYSISGAASSAGSTEKYSAILDVSSSSYGFYNEFSKSVEYSWQNEFRISVDLSNGKMSEDQWEQTTEFARLTSELATYDDPGSLLIDIGDIISGITAEVFLLVC